MLTGFTRYDLSEGEPTMSITANGTSLNEEVSKMLGRPERAELLIDEKGKRIAVVPCGKDAKGTINFGGDRKLSNGIRFNNRGFQSKIATLMGWDLSVDNYRISGIYLDEDQAMVFDLNKARRFKKRNASKIK